MEVETDGIPFEDRTAPDPSPLLSTSSLLGGLMQDLAERYTTRQGGGWTGGIRCGIPMIDKDLRGLRPGSVTILNAEPNIGKTTLSNQICYQSCVYPGAHTAALYVSFENDPTDLLLKHLARLSGWPTTTLEDGEISPTDDQLQSAVRQLSTLPLFYLRGTPATTADLIKRRAEQAQQATNGADLLLVIDYLQFFARFIDARQTIDQLGKALAFLSHLADTTGAALLVIGSQNRKANERPDAGMYGGRGSGEIEYDADCLLTMAREGKTVTVGGGKQNYGVKLNCAKARFGGQGAEASLTFHHDRTCFEV